MSCQITDIIPVIQCQPAPRTITTVIMKDSDIKMNELGLPTVKRKYGKYQRTPVAIF